MKRAFAKVSRRLRPCSPNIQRSGNNAAQEHDQHRGDRHRQEQPNERRESNYFFRHGPRVPDAAGSETDHVWVCGLRWIPHFSVEKHMSRSQGRTDESNPQFVCGLGRRTRVGGGDLLHVGVEKARGQRCWSRRRTRGIRRRNGRRKSGGTQRSNPLKLVRRNLRGKTFVASALIGVVSHGEKTDSRKDRKTDDADGQDNFN